MRVFVVGFGPEEPAAIGGLGQTGRGYVVGVIFHPLGDGHQLAGGGVHQIAAVAAHRAVGAVQPEPVLGPAAPGGQDVRVGVLIIPQVASRGRVPHRGGAAVGGVILLQGTAVVAAVLQGLALLKVELAVVGAQIPGKPLIRDVVGALDQLAALAGAGVVAVKFNGGALHGGPELLKVVGQGRVGHIAHRQQRAVVAGHKVLCGLQRHGLQFTGGQVNADGLCVLAVVAGGHHPVQGRVVAKIKHVIHTLGGQVDAGLAVVGQPVHLRRGALLLPQAVVVGLQLLGREVGAVQLRREVLLAVFLPGLIRVEKRRVEHIDRAVRHKGAVVAVPPREPGRAVGAVVGAAGHGAGDGLCGGGVVGFEQQAAVIAVDHFIVGVAAVEAAVVAVQPGEVPGGGGRGGGSGGFGRGGGQGCRIRGGRTGGEQECGKGNGGKMAVAHRGSLLFK